MRLFLVFAVCLLSLCSWASAQEVVIGEPVHEPARLTVSTELVDAHYAYEQAKLRLRQYRQVTLPQQRRTLDEQIRLGDREIQVLRRRLRDYRPFLEVDEFSPVRTAADSHRLTLLAAESRVRQLRDARLNQMRYTRQNYQLLKLEVLRAAVHLAEVHRSINGR